MLPMLLATIENDVDRALFAEIYEQYHERMEIGRASCKERV